MAAKLRDDRNVIVRTKGRLPSDRADLPDAILQRYHLDAQRWTVDLYRAPTDRDPVFRTENFHQVTRRSDPDVVRDMMDVVRHRRWEGVALCGEASFRREAWLQARTSGLEEVWGYQPAQRDLQVLAVRRAVQAQREAPNSHPDKTPRRTLQGHNVNGPAYRLWRSEQAFALHVSDPVQLARLIKGARAQAVAKLSRSDRVRDLHRDQPELFSRDRVNGR